MRADHKAAAKEMAPVSVNLDELKMSAAEKVRPATSRPSHAPFHAPFHALGHDLTTSRAPGARLSQAAAMERLMTQKSEVRTARDETRVSGIAYLPWFSTARDETRVSCISPPIRRASHTFHDLPTGAHFA